MPKISKAQGPSHPPTVELYPEPGPGEPARDGMADAPGQLGNSEPIPTPTSGISGTVDGSGNVTTYTEPDSDTADYDTLAEDDEDAEDGEEDGDADEGVALPPQNAVKGEWENALLDLGVSHEWIAEDENGRPRTKDDLITVGRAIRDGRMVVDDNGDVVPLDG